MRQSTDQQQPNQKIKTAFSGNIHYQLSGKENNPNIIINQGSKNTSYISKDLYIFSKIHDANDNVSAEKCGELVIENVPITNSDKKLLVCFSLKTVESDQINHLDIDKIIQNTYDSSYIDLNESIIMEDECSYYETKTATVLVFKTPLNVSSYFTGFTKGNIQDLQIIPEHIEEVRASSQVRDHILGVTARESITSSFKEGFIEGNDEDIKWMECDNVPLDYTEEIPTYQIAAGSVTKDYQTQLLGATINIIWAVSIVIFLIFILPSIYTLLVVRGIGIETGQDTILELIRNFEFTWIIVLLLPAIILIITGTTLSNVCNSSLNDLSNNTDPNNANMYLLNKCIVKVPSKISPGWPNSFTTSDEVKDALGQVKIQLNHAKNTAISGGAILGFWFISTTIMAFYKVLNPDFLHISQSNGFSFNDKGRKILALPTIPSGKFIVFWMNVLVPT